MNLRTLTRGIILFATCSFVRSEPQVLYWGGGTSDIANGTPLPTVLANLSGTWNTTTKNWAIDAAGSRYTNWPASGPAPSAIFGTGVLTAGSPNVGTITLSTSLAANSLRFLSPNTANFGRFDLTATAPVTLTFSGEVPAVRVLGSTNWRADILSNVRLAGAAGLVVGGSRSFAVKSDSPALTGTLTSEWTTTAGSLEVEGHNGGRLTGIGRFDLISSLGGVLRVYASGTGVNSVLDDEAVVRLGSASVPFEYRGHADNSDPSVENISKLLLDSHGILALQERRGSGTQNGRLVLAHPVAGIDRGPSGRGTMFVQAQSDYTLRTDVVVANGYAANTRLPWAVSTLGTGVRLNASKIIEAISGVYAPTAPASWVAGSEYIINSPVVGALNSIAINALGVWRNHSGTETLTIGAAQTLTLSQGLLARVSRGGTGVYALSGGKITSGTGELYVFTAQGVSQPLQIDTEITGAIDVIAAGASSLTFGGSTPNTYTGKTYVNSHAGLTLAKDDGVTSIPGDLVVCANGKVSSSAGQDYQIATSANVTVLKDGTLSIEAETLNGVVTITGGLLNLSYYSVFELNRSVSPGLVFNGGRIAYSRENSQATRINTDVSYAATASEPAVFTALQSLTASRHDIDINTTAGGVTRTWNIANSESLSAFVPEMTTTRSFARTGAGTVLLRKTGTGALQLNGYTDNWADSIEVNGGTLIANSQAATVVLTGTLRHGSSAIRDLPSTVGLRPGMRVLALGVPNRRVFVSGATATQILSVDSPTQVTVSTAVVRTDFEEGYTAAITFAGITGTDLVLSGNTVNLSPVVTGLASTTGLFSGQPLTGTGIPNDTLVASVDSASQITLSANATATGAPALTFGTFRNVPAFARHIVQDGNIVNGSPVVTGLATTEGLIVGQRVIGSSGLASTTIVSIDSATQVTVAVNATQNGARTLTFWGASAVGRSTVSVNANGTFVATGAGGAVTVASGGTLDPGTAAARVGNLSAMDVTLQAGSTWNVDIDGDASNDALQCYGNIALAGEVEVTAAEGYTLPAAGEWVIATYTGTATGGMTAPTGFRVTVDAVNQRVLLTRSADGTVLMLR